MLRTNRLAVITVLVLILFQVTIKSGYSQSTSKEDSLIITGIIWDAESFEPLPYANVYTSNRGTFSNGYGEYKIQVLRNDTLTVSYMGYETQKTIISGDSDHQFFWLKSLTETLQEVVIEPLPTEKAMKDFILRTETEYPEQTLRGKQSMQIIQNMYLGGYRPELNSLDNYLNYMKGPQDASILSTNPRRGIGRVLKNIKGN